MISLPVDDESDARETALIVRSVVEPKRDYRDYRPTLRKDFWFSCAYCTVCESEAGGHRFTIDHYEPRSARPDLETDYNNLFYACDTCNEIKGDRSPPESARADGQRFFRSDQDDRGEHFELNGILLEGKTNVGSFTIDACYLNRSWLRKLRELRRRLWECEKFAEQGVMSLRKLSIDQLPPEVRARAQHAIEDAQKNFQEYKADVELILRGYAMSVLVENNDLTTEERDRRIERVKRLKSLEKEYPENWRPGRQRR